MGIGNPILNKFQILEYKFSVQTFGIYFQIDLTGTQYSSSNSYKTTFLICIYHSRRWMNGTLACILYFSFNENATKCVDGGTIHLNSKRIVYALWAMNLYQYASVMIAPAVFGVACYTSLTNGSPGIYLSSLFGDSTYHNYYTHNTSYNTTDDYTYNNLTHTTVITFTNESSFSTDETSYWISTYPITDLPLNYPGILVAVYLICYAVWVYISFAYDSKKVKIFLEKFLSSKIDGIFLSELRSKIFNLISIILVCLGVVVVFPVYFALVYGLITDISELDIIVIITMFGPVVIALSQSLHSAILYLKYLFWFLFMLIYFLVFLPSYAIARYEE